jgi:putative ABC transport system substrate-binding protein
MKIFFILTISLFLYAQDVLVIDSNSKVEKYNESVDAFVKNFHKPYKILNIGTMKSADIKESLYAQYPDIVYAVGSKAYQYAYKYIPEKKIFFSSIVNWKRLPKVDEMFGISNEIYSGMQLTLIKSVFPEIKSIGVVYSKYTKNIVDDLKQNANKLGIKILSKEVTIDSIKNVDLTTLVKHSESMLIISDPIFLSNQTLVEKMFKISSKYKKPIFAYHKLFIKYGAILSISVDNPTIGRQMASIITDCLDDKKIKNIQYPIGTKVVFNKKVAKKLGIKYSKNISYVASEIIE